MRSGFELRMVERYASRVDESRIAEPANPLSASEQAFHVPVVRDANRTVTFTERKQVIHEIHSV